VVVASAGARGETRRPPEPLFGRQGAVGVLRYLPAALVATLSVTVLPAVLANALIGARGPLGALCTVGCAVAISLLLAAAESTAWKRAHGVRGVVFSELMLWSFARRLWAERRLRKIGAAYAAAADCSAGDGRARVELLEGLSSLLETRNPYTHGHCRRVARQAERIARTMGLGAPAIAEIRAAALIHDVGKVYTPAEILQKPGPLTEQEFAVIKRHAEDGAEMLAPVRDRRLAAIVRHHHERLDGSGYPDGLHGQEIPLGARIIAVADTFDAVTSHRPYRRARSQREGLAVLAGESGTKLDDTAVAAFLDVYAPRRAIASVSFSAAAWARLAPVQLLPGGLFGGASLTGLLPAIGAAGLLAVTPGARYERAAPQSSPAAVAALQPAFPAAFGGGTVAGGVSFPSPSQATGPPGSSRVHVRRTGRTRAVVAPTPPSPSAGGTSQSGGEAPVPAVSPVPGAAPLAVDTHSGLLGATVSSPVVPPPPALTTPTVTVPAVTAPALSGAPVSLPGVSVGAGGVSVGSLSTPSVAVGPVSVPSIALPGVTVVPAPAPGAGR
jgi:putative nucleotidyltransferase with HDIG domain